MKYFNILELTQTSTKLDNNPNQDEIKNLILLVDNVLDPLREAINNPIHIESGYRSPLVNREVGGSKTSAHMKGCAADITRGSKIKNKEMFDWIKNNCEFRQLINEYDYSWVHVEYRLGYNKKQILEIN